MERTKNRVVSTPWLSLGKTSRPVVGWKPGNKYDQMMYKKYNVDMISDWHAAWFDEAKAKVQCAAWPACVGYWKQKHVGFWAMDAEAANDMKVDSGLSQGAWRIGRNRFVKSPVNSGCPDGYEIINNRDECFEAYDILASINDWTGKNVRKKEEGTWSWVMQCGVRVGKLATDWKITNGVHYKTDLVDGSVKGTGYAAEKWVHVCKRKIKYVKSSFNTACPIGYDIIDGQKECERAYNDLKVIEGWSGTKAIPGTWSHVMQCGVLVKAGGKKGNTNLHFKTNNVDGPSYGYAGEKWVHVCKYAPEYVKSAENSACPWGYGVINVKTECFRAYDILKVKNNWTGAKIDGTWDWVMQCGVQLDNKSVHFKTNEVDGSVKGTAYSKEKWVHLCKKTPRYVKSEINTSCPTGYEVIDNKAECFMAYDSLKVKNNWTGTKIEGTWNWIMQCGVSLDNKSVHFKTNKVDGSVIGTGYSKEKWVHVCRLSRVAEAEESDLEQLLSELLSSDY